MNLFNIIIFILIMDPPSRPTISPVTIIELPDNFEPLELPPPSTVVEDHISKCVLSCIKVNYTKPII